MTIRRAKITDLPMLQSLLQEILVFHHELLPGIFKSKGMKYDERALTQLLNDEHYLILVMEQDAKIIGHAYLAIQEIKNHPTLENKRILFLDDLYIVGSFRGQGLGKMMLEFLKTLAKKEAFDEIRLHVWLANKKARAFYQSLGFSDLMLTMNLEIKE